MTGHIGFSYIGFIFLMMLMIPNLIWTRQKPKDYDTVNENKVLLIFERTGQVLVTCTSLVLSDFNLHKWTAWSWWLAAAFLLMLCYEYWWVRYFRSKQTLADFYSGFWGIPVAGATLPVAAFLMLGIYGKSVWLIAFTILLGIGHIGIHIQHYVSIIAES